MGSGPAGMAAAQQLRRAGHRVTLFERDEAIGGLVRFGVPDFKIEKTVVQRRVEQLLAEGVEIRCGVEVGSDVSVAGAARRLRRGRAGDRLARAARPARPRPRARRRALRDGLPLPAQPLGGARARPRADRRPAAGAARDHGRGQGRGRDRRRRHRRGLRGQLAARGRALGGPARAAVRAPGAPPRRAHAVAAVAAEVPPQLRDGGGHEARRGRAGLLGHDHRVRRRRQRRARAACASRRPRRSRRSPRCRAPSASCRRSWCCWRWASCTPSRSCSTSSAWRRTRAATSRSVKPYTTSVDGVFAAGDARRGQSLIVWAINEGRQCARMVDRYLASRQRRRAAAARCAPKTAAWPATPTRTAARRGRPSTSGPASAHPTDRR